MYYMDILVGLLSCFDVSDVVQRLDSEIVVANAVRELGVSDRIHVCCRYCKGRINHLFDDEIAIL